LCLILFINYLLNLLVKIQSSDKNKKVFLVKSYNYNNNIIIMHSIAGDFILQ